MAMPCIASWWHTDIVSLSELYKRYQQLYYKVANDFYMITLFRTCLDSILTYIIIKIKEKYALSVFRQAYLKHSENFKPFHETTRWQLMKFIQGWSDSYHKLVLFLIMPLQMHQHSEAWRSKPKPTLKGLCTEKTRRFWAIRTIYATVLVAQRKLFQVSNRIRKDTVWYNQTYCQGLNESVEYKG